MRICVLIFTMLWMTGCAGKNPLNDFKVSVGLVSAYDAAVGEFKQGQVVEARTRLLSVKKEHEDYKKSQIFLKGKVNPARLKLLGYYARKGKKEEKAKHWAQAEQAYKTAVELSTQPQALQRYQAKMNLKVRQLRLDTIYKQRKKEDKAWLKWQQGYTPPKGLFGDDKAFVMERNHHDTAFQTRVEQTWRLAQDFEKMDKPEMAWLYADAYLRLMPDTKKAQDLKNAMATAVPKGFKLPKLTSVKTKTVKHPKDVKKATDVKSVQSLMDKKEWVLAKKEAQTLRKQGIPKADKLLEEINDQMKDLAEKAYSNGNLAFRSERIDEAVEFWQQAVGWAPSEQTYTDSLRRGKQIQERLSALKTEAEEEE